MNSDVRTVVFGLGGVLVYLLLGVHGLHVATAETLEDGKTEKPIVLSLGAQFKKTERPPVLFFHDKHATALQEKGCSACHIADDDGNLSYAYPPQVQADSRNSYRAAYHQHCIGCHRDRNIVGALSPPSTCGECHVRKQAISQVTWPDAGFDYYSHSIHIDVAGEDCTSCHHTGTMTSCRDCHREDEGNEAQPFRQTAHSSCIRCHLEAGAGPASCNGCHADTKSWTVEDIAEAPRPDIGQPDNPLIAADQATMTAVSFSHREHEGYTIACRTCHHETMGSCDTCHTIEGSTDGGMITLGFAYHEGGSERSCVGCHNKQKASAECAGCHHTMGGATTKNSCRDCHSGSAVPPLFAAGLCASSVTLPDSPQWEIVIEKVAVDQDKYLPVPFSHGAHIEKLTALSNNNCLSRYFHSDSMTVCAGCHHYSPLEAKKPVPPCSTCHSLNIEPRTNVPTLYAAYHQQCLGCHVQMLVQPTTCTGCHKEKESALQANAD